MKRARWLLPALIVVGACNAAAPALYRYYLSAMLGPVAVEVQMITTTDARARRAVQAGSAEVSKIHNLLSRYLEASEVSRINRESGRETHASAQTVEVVRRAIEIARLTDGAFDITVGPLVALWRDAIRSGELPDPEELERARGLVGYQQITVGDNSVTLEKPGMSIDLGGIAKGYAVDRVVRALRDTGIEDALVDAGGDGYAMGLNAQAEPWRIGLEHPRQEGRAPLGIVLRLSDRAYATSGDYRQYTEIDGERYSHIIDPRTGRPAREAASATVVAPDCMTADALATALLVMPPEAGVELVDSLEDVECLIITIRDDELHKIASSGFYDLTDDARDRPADTDDHPPE